MKEGILLLKTFIVPQIMGILNKSSSSHLNEIENLDSSFFKQLINELDFKFSQMKKELSDSRKTVSNNLETISKLSQKQPRYENLPPMPVRSDEAYEHMQAEKAEMHNKLDEFSSILQAFQQNQRQFELENH